MVLAQLLVCLLLVKRVLAVTLGVRVYQSGMPVLNWFGALALPEFLALLGGTVGAGLLVGGTWLLFQLLSQQGRLLLRIEALEARLPPDGSASQRVPADTGTGSVPLDSLPVAAPATLLASSHVSHTPAMPLHRSPVPPTEEEGAIELTIGMATYNDFDGVYFTLQALRLYQDLEHTELLVIDNYGCEHTKNLVEGWLKGRYIRATDVTGTAAPRELVFREARGKAVLCCDCHVLFAPGVIAQLKQFYREHPDCQDLLQGPLLYDDGKLLATHFDPQWRGQMWGIWATDPRGQDPLGEPFEIPMQGLGVFSCRKRAWLSFHPGFRGFGGEEGYIHEKFRQAGRRCLCLPWFRWMHRFSRPSGVLYPLTVEDKLHNYVLGHAELGLDLTPVLQHFSDYLPRKRVLAIAEQALGEPWTDSSLAATAAPAIDLTATNSSWAAQLADPPPVSCICLTYGRPFLLEEAIYSFLQQDYNGPKELIVLNDYDQQLLEFDHPEVRVINLPKRLCTVGEKMNAAVALASHQLVFVWDDDDIYLPHRLTFSLENFDPQKGFFKPDKAWIWDNGQVSGPAQNVFHVGSCWSRRLFDAVHGYPADGTGYDLLFEQRLAQHFPGSIKTYAIRPEDIYYIYRWGGTGSYHMSGFGAYRPGANVGHQEVEADIQRRAAAGEIMHGHIHLTPNWKQDYQQLVSDYLQSLSANQSQQLETAALVS